MMSPEIIDDVSPHHWSASTVLQDWDNDYEAYSKAEYVTKIPLCSCCSRPTSTSTAVTPKSSCLRSIAMSSMHDGSQENGILTVALRKTDQRWRITAFAWTKQ
jgi:hypothetical protein